MADSTIAFCEKCGRDRDVFRSDPDAFRLCPRCGSACCPDCWNLTGGGCLSCIPFSLPPPAPQHSIAPIPGGSRAAGGATAGTADGVTGRATDAGEGAVVRRATRKPVSRSDRQLQVPVAAASFASAPPPADGGEPLPPGRGTVSHGRRMVRFLAGIAMSAVVVVGLSVAAFAATWPQESRPAPQPPPSAPQAGQVVVEATAAPTEPPAASTKPPAPRTAGPATPRPVTPRASDRPAVPRRTTAPVVIVAPPAPGSTPAPTPRPTPVAPTEPPPPPPTAPPPPEPTPEPPAETPPEPPAP